MASLVLFYMRGHFSAVHLKKDVGLFPLYLKKEYFDSAEIVKIGTDDKTDYSTKELKVKNLFYEPRVNDDSFQHSKAFELKCVWKSFLYLLKRKDITHIMMFNVTRYTLGLSLLVKIFMPKRKTYLKLDANTDVATQLAELPKDFKRKLFYKLIAFSDIISIETRQNYEILSKNPYFSEKLHLIPNGFENPVEPNKIQKENVILTVGTIGLPVKNSDILLESLKTLDFKNWKFYFVGPVEDDFKGCIESFYSDFPYLKERVFFFGSVFDKEKLAELYRKANVFILPSKYESFGIATIEAASYGTYLVLTDTGVARDLVIDETFGYILPESTTKEQHDEKLKNYISAVLQKIIDGEIDTGRDMQKRLEYINEKFSMQRIVRLPVFREWGR